MIRLIICSLLGLTLAGCSASTKQTKNYEPCGISLISISKTAGLPGDILELYGQWGDSQGEKVAAINRHGLNRLEVIAWTDAVITVRIPRHLDAGNYKIGVYCNDLSKGGAYSSGWVKFEVLRPAP